MTQKSQQANFTIATLWLMDMSAIGYLLLLAGLIFLPGTSLIERLRWLDSGICAQILTHSFYPGGERLPLCARNTGIYLGFLVSLITLYATGKGRVQQLPPWPIRNALLIGIMALGIDGTNSLLLDLGQFHLYQPQNFLRLGSGLLTGLAMAAFFLPLLNNLLWCGYHDQSSISSWKTLVWFMPLLLLCFLAIMTQNSMLLYPIALLSTMGLLIALSSVNLIIVMAISRHEQKLVYYRELFPFFSLAFVCATGELLALAQLKLLLLQALGISY